ncbi:cytochrome c [Nodosilinea sp. LEGE 07298]|uniref:c-type cytochrome n=1 Tax=Nodosilinea sp. LEGE 07298 TaxID=2777970 RepID=UPI00187F294E|nr:cytochrome c [Nodosilinea sp. LEGE 07298]MBE9108818.1 cytochrome c [Nodosilinea sp. LEGE 07298]
MAQETLDEQDNDLRNLLKKAALIAVMLVIAVVLSVVAARYSQASDPYIHQVLSMQGNSTRGEAIFRMNCAVCHGIEATGEVGPKLVGVSDHKTKVGLIKQVISGQTPPMPQFQPEPQDMADLLIYLERL